MGGALHRQARRKPALKLQCHDLVIHDTGAYGASMSSNYNSRPLAVEVLVEGSSDRQIRRRQTVEELIALES